MSLIIEAKYCGNITRHINHSCFPNVTQVLTYPSIPDFARFPPMPRLIFVAWRDILKEQEITFNYQAHFHYVRTLSCRCYEPGCLVPPRKSLFY